ncbi:MAG: lipopolysaccharide biosynthesis protein [Granulosicoccus sp.]
MAKVNKGSRLRHILSLTKGTLLAQIVFVAATPVLTRVYSPEELGVFGVFTALVLVMARFAGLRLELAIVLPKRDAMALRLAELTIVVCIGVLLLFSIAYMMAVNAFGLSHNHHALQAYVPLVVIGVLLFLLNETLVFWSIRKQQFAVVANARIINAVLLAILQLFGFFFAQKLLILIAAYPIALAAAIIYQARHLDLDLIRQHSADRLRHYRILLHRYQRFPKYTTWSTGLSELSQALPLFVLSVIFGNLQAGYFFLARRIGLLPTSIIGRAITQVNHADMLSLYQSGKLGQSMVRQMHWLQWICILPAAIIAYFAPALCELAFGENWNIAGLYLQYLTPYVVVRFIFAPAGAINHVAEWQKLELAFILISSSLSTAALVWFSTHGEANRAVAAYFLALFICDLLYRLFIMSRLNVNLIHLLKPTLIQVLGISAIGIVVSMR